MKSDRPEQGSRISVERVFGIALAILSLVCIFSLASSSYLVFWDASGPGPSWLPYVLSASLLILSVFLIILRNRTTLTQLGASPSGTGKYIVLILALAWAFPVIGGLLSLGLFVAIEMVWVEKNKWLIAIAAGLISTAIVWGVFVKLLGVTLPSGPFGI
jgi:putative tricarboxylic transport membrane protein